ncbi:MAG: hypothetical protein U1E76_18025 [Planctomycetota bacterium]
MARSARSLRPIVALAILLVASAALSPVFLAWRTRPNILNQNAFVGIIAIGMTFVIIMGGIDLSVGRSPRSCAARHPGDERRGAGTPGAAAWWWWSATTLGVLVAVARSSRSAWWPAA